LPRFVLALTAALALAITSHAASETFVWLPNSEPDVAGYRIYYGSPPGEYSEIADVGNVTRATIDGLTPGATYRFYATCYNAAGLESDPSDTVELVIPTDPTENRPPVALGATVTAVSGEITTLTLEAEDPDGDPLSFNLASFPMHGEIIDYPIANGHRATLTYQSLPGYTGTDEFLFTVNDGWSDSTPATVTIQVLAIDTAPILTAIQLRGDWGVGLRWAALPGREYQVAYCDSLDPTHWLLLPDVFLASPDQIEIEIELEQPLPSMPGQRFYRVLLLPVATGN
jgi:hypothetical protein